MASLSAQLLCISMITMASIAIVEAKGIGIEIGSREVAEFREFDYFALALQWPGTICHRTGHCCSSNACCRGSNGPTEFTIHGLWPDYNDGTWPACCTQENFDEKEISTLIDALEKYWPSLSCGKPSTCHGGRGLFWAHEWEKHGTCSSPVLRDEYSYFLTTLNVYFKYNVTVLKLLACICISSIDGSFTLKVLPKRVLTEAGYVPSNKEKYPLGGIISAIQNAFGATPLLICKKGAVEELRLCFYKDFKPRDCVIGSTGQSFVLSSTSSCPNYVSLPIPEYASIGVESAETTISSVLGDEAL